MAGRMQRDRYAIDVEAFAICCGLQIDSRQPRYEDPCTRLRGEVVRVTPARMVGMVDRYRLESLTIRCRILLRSRSKSRYVASRAFGLTLTTTSSDV